ncbi:MAG TPA: DUF4349 domain-containing protein, partial [Ktedonobacterales bacterium]|nr:DUF4349 domain-containing protein [Ktedonobacterales bacterium]
RWTRWGIAAGVALALVVLTVLAGCGASNSNASTAGPNTGASSNSSTDQSVYGPAATAGTGQSSTSGPQYLIKTLAVSMTFSDTRATATDLQHWIAATDPRSSSAGVTYQEQATNRYQITMTFSVAASAYPQVFSYLAGYAQTHHGTLNNLHESVQDVSNDYVDTTSRLKNLRTEQDRLLALLSQAKSLSDTLAIEQRLTDVEGQIEQIEAHLNALNGQTTFYMVTITLMPFYTAAPDSPSAPWNPGQTFHDALTAALGFGQGLVSVLIWLATFAIYVIPVVVIFLLVRRWRRARAAERPAPAIAPAVASAAAPSPPAAVSQPPSPPTS